MNKLILIILCTVGSMAMAEKHVYQLAMALTVGKEPAESFGLIVAEGQNGAISAETNGKKTAIEVVASEGQIQGHKGILLKLKIITTDKAGKKTVLGTPEILAEGGSPASISVSDNAGNPDYTLKVTATRK